MILMGRVSIGCRVHLNGDTFNEEVVIDKLYESSVPVRAGEFKLSNSIMDYSLILFALHGANDVIDFDSTKSLENSLASRIIVAVLIPEFIVEKGSITISYPGGSSGQGTYMKSECNYVDNITMSIKSQMNNRSLCVYGIRL